MIIVFVGSSPIGCSGQAHRQLVPVDWVVGSWGPLGNWGCGWGLLVGPRPQCTIQICLQKNETSGILYTLSGLFSRSSGVVSGYPMSYVQNKSSVSCNFPLNQTWPFSVWTCAPRPWPKATKISSPKFSGVSCLHMFPIWTPQTKDKYFKAIIFPIVSRSVPFKCHNYPLVN